MNKSTLQVLFCLLVAALLEAILAFAYHSYPNSRILELLGGNLPGGIIQGITYFLFFYGMLEVRNQNKATELEEDSFDMNLLPTKENWLLSPQDVTDLRLKIIEHEKNRKSLLTDLIKKGCNKYRSDKSPADALAVISEQNSLSLAQAESSQSRIRYIAWAIPSVGFIGTVIGISQSLALANQASDPDGIDRITSALSVAFDTTLVSLVLSLLIMYFYHELVERVEKLHAKAGSYVIENLINRMYHS